jgi:hypothetical protein
VTDSEKSDEVLYMAFLMDVRDALLEAIDKERWSEVRRALAIVRLALDHGGVK